MQYAGRFLGLHVKWGLSQNAVVFTISHKIKTREVFKEYQKEGYFA